MIKPRGKRRKKEKLSWCLSDRLFSTMIFSSLIGCMLSIDQADAYSLLKWMASKVQVWGLRHLLFGRNRCRWLKIAAERRKINGRSRGG